VLLFVFPVYGFASLEKTLYCLTLPGGTPFPFRGSFFDISLFDRKDSVLMMNILVETSFPMSLERYLVTYAYRSG